MVQGICMTFFSTKSKIYQLKLTEKQGLSSLSDEILIQKVANQDEAAFSILFHRYYSKLYRFVSRMTGYIGSTEEAINDTMYVIWNRAETFKQGNKLSTWIFGIAYNKAMKSLEKGKRHQANSEPLPDEMGIGDSSIDIEQMETGLWLSAALAQLSPDHRMVVELSYYYGMPYDEIAEVMDCNASTVKTRMFYARKRLREILPQLSEQIVSTGDDHDNE